MKVLTTISGLFRGHIGDQLFYELMEIHPDGVCGNYNHMFRSMLPQDDPITIRILECLNRAGMKPHQRGRTRKDGIEYIYVLHRRYEYDDLKNFKFVECMPLDGLSDPQVDENDCIIANVREFKSHEQVKRYFIGEYRILVRDDVRKVLESASLTHVLFKPVTLKPPRQKRSDWWELLSDFIMPPLSPSLEITSRGKRAERGVSAFAWGFSEGVYAYPELRYLRSEVESLEPFDLALTLEGQSGSKRMIASHRYYETCVMNDVDTNWIPVHVEDG